MDFDTEIAVFLIHVLLDKKTPIHFNELCALIDRQFNIRLKHSGLSNLLKKFEDNFEECFENGHRFVKLITNLSICETYCSNAAHCPGDSNCTGLHICKFYLLEGKCRFGGTCKFGHDLTIAHNSRLLRENLLSGFSVDHIRYLLTLPENRTKSTIPIICKFYNNAAGCRQSNSGSCPFLHMCKYYLLGKCQFSQKCSRNHNVDGNVRSILKRHGIDTDKPISELMSELRGIFTSDTVSEAEDELGTTQAEAPLRWSSQPVLSTASKVKSLSLGPDQFSQLKKQTRPAVKQFQRTPSTGDLDVSESDRTPSSELRSKDNVGRDLDSASQNAGTGNSVREPFELRQRQMVSSSDSTGSSTKTDREAVPREPHRNTVKVSPLKKTHVSETTTHEDDSLNVSRSTAEAKMMLKHFEFLRIVLCFMAGFLCRKVLSSGYGVFYVQSIAVPFLCLEAGFFMFKQRLLHNIVLPHRSSLLVGVLMLCGIKPDILLMYNKIMGYVTAASEDFAMFLFAFLMSHIFV